jgi:hypothetical protein
LRFDVGQAEGAFHDRLAILNDEKRSAWNGTFVSLHQCVDLIHVLIASGHAASWKK